MHKIVVVDYGMGNIGSIVKKLRRVGSLPLVTADGKDIVSAEKIVLPGVGHFSVAAKNLKKNGIWDALNEAVINKKVPVLGICLGMQLFANCSQEGNESGLGWIDAEVIKFDVADKMKFKIPHTGWNHVELKKTSPLFNEVDLMPGFYFVHSLYMVCKNPDDVLATTEYAYPFVSAVQRENIFGVQFHPEKSHDCGERLLLNFSKL